MANAREVFERIRNGTATEKDMELVQKTAAAHIDDHRVKHEYGNITGVVQGNREDIQNIHDSIHHDTQLLLKANNHTDEKHVRLDMIHNMRNISNNVYNANSINTDINENLHTEDETFKLRNKI